MSIIYAACGILLLTLNTSYLRLSGMYKNILGLALILYAGFRAYRVYQNYIQIQKEAEDED